MYHLRPTLADLPDELLAKIFSHFDPFERKLCCQVNKRFLNICRSLPVKFYFHLQGNTKTLFESGLKSMSSIKYKKYTTVKISKFCLIDVLDVQVKEGKLFDKPMVEFVNSAVEVLELYECIVTDKSIKHLICLFPKVKYLGLIRCFLTWKGEFDSVVLPRTNSSDPRNGSSNETTAESQLLFKFEKITLTNPLYSDLRPEVAFGWLFSHCGPKTEFIIQDSPVSHKRSVARRFAKALSLVSSQELIARFTLDPRIYFDVLRDSN